MQPYEHGVSGFDYFTQRKLHRALLRDRFKTEYIYTAVKHGINHSEATELGPMGKVHVNGFKKPHLKWYIGGK